MKVLRKKQQRELWQEKGQFLVIFLMVFLGMLAFAGVHSYMDGMRFSGDRYYEENNLQDLWMYKEAFTVADLEKVRSLPNVRNAERVLTIPTTLEGFEDVTLETNFIESSSISSMYLFEGEEFSREKNGVWLDRMLADAHNLKTGDEITFRYQDYTLTEMIRGLVYTPDHVYSVKDETAIFPDHSIYGYMYLSIDEFPEDIALKEIRKEIAARSGLPLANLVTEGMIRTFLPEIADDHFHFFPVMLVDVEDTSMISETRALLEKEIDSVIAVTGREVSASWAGYHSEIEEGETYSVVFTFLFLFIAALSVVTTMNRFVRRQRTQIGTLKALGVRKAKIIWHYLSYGLWLGGGGAVLGVIVGHLTIGSFFLKAEAAYFEVPEMTTHLEPIVFMMAGLVVTFILLITWLSCRKVLKEPAAQALRVERPVVKVNKRKAAKSRKSREVFSVTTRWNIRDVRRNRGRTVMAAAGIIGCTMLIVCALGMLDTINSYFTWEFETISNFDWKISLEENIEEKTLQDLEKLYGKNTSETMAVEVQKKGAGVVTSQLTVNDAEEALRYTDHHRNLMKLPEDGVMVTEKMAENLGIGPGDEITWHVIGEETSYTTAVAGFNRDPQSQQMNMSRAFYESLGREYKADTLYTKEDLSGIRDLPGTTLVQSLSSMENGMKSMMDTMFTLVILLIVLSAILAFVIIYNLGILSLSEKQYQFATMKVLGFRSSSIRRIFVEQNIWISTGSILVGLPLGFFMTDYIFKEALSDVYDFPGYVQPVSFVIAAVFTGVLSLLINRILSSRIKTVDMVSSLKANE